MNFIDNLSQSIPATEIASKGGLAYLSAATAVGRAGRPNFSFVDFPAGEGKTLPYLEMLGGAVVAVDVTISADVSQRMFLHVMDRDNNAMALKNITVNDINNSRQRCLVKAIAGATGVGMSVFLGTGGDGDKAVKMLGLEPTTDLSAAEATVSTLAEGGAPYVEWNVGLSAARITDAGFVWSVEMTDGLPYREVLGGLQVDVTTLYQGKSLTLSLPLMDAAFNPIPAAKANVSDWNKAVMRALTKCIAFNSGYGLAIYADETGLKAEASSARRKPGRKDTKETSDKPAGDAAETGTAQQTTVAQQDAKSSDSNAAAATSVAASQTTDTGDQVAEGTAATEATAKVDAPSAQADAPASAEAAPVSASAETTAKAESEVKADAQSTATTGEHAEAVGRFQGVMKKRRDMNGVEGLMTLFKALSVSDKYRDDEKPACFVALISGIATLVDGTQIGPLLNEIGAYNAASYLEGNTRRVVVSRLVDIAIQGAMEGGDDAIVDAAKQLVESGLAEDIADVFNISQEGTLSAETKELLTAILEPQAA